MKQLKTIIIGIIIAFTIFPLSIVILFFILHGNPRLGTFINHGIYLPKPVEIKVIYRFDFRNGQDLEIWIYQKENFDKIFKNKKFRELKNDKSFIIKEKIDKYYSFLDAKEQKKFNKNVKLRTIMNTENFYYYRQNKDDQDAFVIMIADIKEMKLYIFDSVT